LLALVDPASFSEVQKPTPCAQTGLSSVPFFPSLRQDHLEGEKNHNKGGLNCVFGNFFFYVLDNCPQVQILK